MGRELKRVPMDFDWPIDVIWKGYENPYQPTDCKPCGGSGYNPETKQISDDFYDLDRTGRRWSDKLTQDEVDALVEHDRLRTWKDGQWVRVPRTAEEVNKANTPHCVGVHEMALDGSSRWVCIRIRAERLGVWGHCRLCDGVGHYWCSDEFEDLYDKWQRIDPPTGDGYQLWTTTSEGAPMSPVFATLDELCEWAAKHATTFAHYRATSAEWKQMLGDGLVYHREGSMVFV